MKVERNIELLKFISEQQEELTGIEYDDSPDDVDDISVFDARDIRVAQKMISVFMIEHWICDGTLNLQPEYQRNLIWDQKRKSALIESILLNIPIPAFYFDEDITGVKNVIDGLQRLSTIHEFINGDFELVKLQYLPACEKKTFFDLDIKYRNKILETILVVNILDERCSSMIKLDIFRRVNTGGVHLNPQEIRNILANAKVRRLLRNMSTCDEFICATRGKINDIRMGAQELCLRYITILTTYSWENHDFEYYQGLLKMMDACVLALNNADDIRLEMLLNQFRKTMHQCHIILGDNSFCKPENTRINKALFTSWAIVLMYYNLKDSEILAKKELILDKYYKALVNDMTFYNSITSSTGSRKYITYSIEVIRNIMEEYYDF